jgi:anthranilate synthase/aminodeoxychorismate synthase-like glutamine amidotransferase
VLLLIDNYDSFTYNLKDYFEQLGQEVLVMMNDELDDFQWNHHNIDAVVISPGPNTPEESGQLMKYMSKICSQFPVLGICLGHQAIGQYFGAELVLAKQPMHGKVSIIQHNQKGIYENLPASFGVCRYHSLVLKHLNNTPLEMCSETEESEIMGLQHKELPIYGMQFHPEAILTEHGLKMLNNWLKHIQN